MMDEKNIQHKEELLKISENVLTSDRQFSVGSDKESSNAGPASVDDVKSIPCKEPVPHVKSTVCMIPISCEMKTHGTLTVLYTSSRKSQITIKKMDNAVLESGKITSVAGSANGSAKAEQELTRVHEADTSFVCERPEQYDHTSKFDDNVEHGSYGRSRVIKGYADGSKSQSNVETTGHVISAFATEDTAHNPGSSAGSMLSSSLTKVAVFENSQNNNNNVEKQAEIHPKTDLSLGTWRQKQNLSGAGRVGHQVSGRDTGKSVSQSHMSHISPSFDEPKSRESLLICDSGGPGCDKGSVSTYLCNQSLPAVSLTLSEPKLSVALHSAGGIMAVSDPVTSFSRPHNRESTILTSQLEHVKPTTLHAVATSQSGESINIQPVPECPRTYKTLVPSSQMSLILNINETGLLSCNADGRDKMTSSQSKSYASHLLLRCLDESSDNLKDTSFESEKKRKLIVHPYSANKSEDSSIPSSLAYPAALSVVADNPKSSFNQSSALSAAVQQPLVSSQLLITDSQPFHCKSSSAISPRSKEFALKATRKPRSRTIKSQKPSLLPVDDDDDDGDDDDDNNDFIPVGMLHLSSKKRQEDGDGEAVKAEMLVVEGSVRAPYQLNQGLNVLYDQQVQVRDDRGQTAGNSGVKEGLGFVEEKQKQNTQQFKPKSIQMGQQMDAQFHELAPKVEAHHQQKDEAQQRHQLLLHLVQQTQQKQLLSKPVSFPKNQGLIIYQPQDVKAASGPQGVNLHNLVKSSSVESEQNDGTQLHQEQKLEQGGQPVRTGHITHEKGFHKSLLHKQQKEEQKYSQRHQVAAVPAAPSAQLKQETSSRQADTPWVGHLPNIPKIAERLLQQSGNDHASLRTDQMVLHCKTDQQLQPSQQLLGSRSDQVTSQPITSTSSSVHHSLPSVNQQHPEIARMLNSPVSPRQPASPRQSLSPSCHMLSSSQSSAGAAALIGARQLVSLSSRQTTSQSAASRPASSPQPLSSQQPVRQVATSQSSSDPWHSVPPSAFSAGHSQPVTGQTTSPELFTDRRQDDVTRIVSQPQKPQFSERGKHKLQQMASDGQQVTSDGQHTAHSFSSRDSFSDEQLQICLSQSISADQPAESFSPGQVIHHRPPEHRNIRSKVPNSRKSQPSLPAQFPPPKVPSSKPPVPVIYSTSTVRYSVPNQDIASDQKPVSTYSSQTMTTAKNVQDQQTTEHYGQDHIPDSAGFELQSHLAVQSLPAKGLLGSSSSSFQSQGPQKQVVEMQLYPSSSHFVQSVNTAVDSKLGNSHILSTVHDRHLQGLGNLTEKETSLIQSLFANSASNETKEMMQSDVNQMSHTMSSVPTVFSSSAELPKNYEDNVRMYNANALFPYQGMRKNEGGLKVLSEIASERYVLAVAGKDDVIPHETNQACHQYKDHGTCDISEKSDLIGQSGASGSTPLKTKPSDLEEENDLSKKKADISPEKADRRTDDKKSFPSSVSKVKEKEAKDLLLPGNETPRREVRQRKPKRPFEQEDMFVKRSPKNPQKNIGNKKHTSVTPVQNRSPSKGRDHIGAQVKLKVKTEQDEVKDKLARQAKSSVEDRIGDDINREETEDPIQGRTGSSPRRLSKRLLVKEKERLESQKKAEDETSRRVSRQSARVDYKEDGFDVVDEVVSAKSARSSRQASISSNDDVAPPDNPERMTTRSKKHDTGNETNNEISKRNNPHEKKHESSTKTKVTETNSSKSKSHKAKLFNSNESRRATRILSRSSRPSSRPRSSVRLDSASAKTPRRMITRQAAAELDRTEHSKGMKAKRSLPVEFVDKLPQLQKRVKKTDESKDILGSPDQKTVAAREGKPKEDLKAERDEEAFKLKKGIISPKLTEKKKQSSAKKNKKNSKLNTLVKIIREDPARPKTEILEDEGGKCAVSKKDCKTAAKPQESKLDSNSETLEVNTEDTLMKKEVMKSNVQGRGPFRPTAEKIDKKVTRSVKNDLEDVEKGTVEDSESNKLGDSKSQGTVSEAAMQPSVIKSTAALSGLAAVSRGSASFFQHSTVSTESSLLSEDQASEQKTLASEKPKLMMYKIVPILDEAVPDLEDSVVPLSGYFIPGGNNDRILLPHSFILRPAVAKMSSSIPITSAASSSDATRHAVISTATSSSLPVASSSTWAPGHIVPHRAVDKPSFSSGLISPSAADISTVRTALSTARSTLSSDMWNSSSQMPPVVSSQMPPVVSSQMPPVVSSQMPTTVSSATHHSVWGAQPSHPQQNSQPPPAVGQLTMISPPRTSTSAASQALPPQYGQSTSWNTTQTPVASSLSSSSSSLTSSPAWNSSSSAAVPPLPSQQLHQQQQQQPWSAASERASLEPGWSSSTSVAVSTVESWSKDYYPNTVYTSVGSKGIGEPLSQRALQHDNSSAQSMLMTSRYGVESAESGTPQQPPMYPSGQIHSASSNTLYNPAGSQEPEFADNRPDALIQGFLRQVSSNPGGFSQELAEFNLGQQDFAYLENRLRQTLSPNTLFSAVTAFDDTNGQGAGVGHDSSLQESISLVHTVNLDMEESNLDGSANLDLSGLGTSSVTTVNPSRVLDGQGTRRHLQEEIQAPADENLDGTEDLDSSLQHIESPGSGEPKGEGKKVPRERKSQYKIIMENGIKRYKCLLCNKCFGNATIYRHLRIHDPDYRVKCSLCDKQYTQRHSLQMHMRKFHSDQSVASGLIKSPKYKELQSPEQEKLAVLKSPASQVKFPGSPVKVHSASVKSPGIPMESPNEPIQPQTGIPMESPNEPIQPQTRILMESPNEPIQPQRVFSTFDPHDESELLKQQAAHRQVEELRRSKAEKKHAAAQRKAAGHVSVEAPIADDGSYRTISDSVSRAVEDTAGQSESNVSSSKYTERSSATYSQADHQNISYSLPISTDGSATNFRLDSSKISAKCQGDYENLSTIKLTSMSESCFQFSSPQPEKQIVPQFHADNIPKPISTPIVMSSQRMEPSIQKSMISPESSRLTHPATDAGKHVCEICNTRLNTKSRYKLHMQRHSNIKTKFCTYCNKGFYTGQELRSHERTHTGEKPYKCEICHMTFAHSGSYISHRKGHEKRGENEPFLIIDGNVQYPSTFKKPRLSRGADGSSKSPHRVRKKAPKSQEASDLELLRQGSQETSVIQRGNPSISINEPGDLAQRDFDMNLPSRRQSLDDQSHSANSFSTSMESPTVSDRNLSSSGSRIVTASQRALSQDHGSREYMPPDDGYSSTTGNVSSDYYGSSARSSMQQQEFLPAQMDASSSQHNYFQQDKHYPRSSGVATYPSSSPVQTVSAPMNLALGKSQQYSGSQSYSDSGLSSRNYYTPQGQSSEYHYSEQPREENVDYQRENYDGSLGQYKSDPSSNEIVKKLLQHYNVPTSSYQEAMPLDYSQQMQVTCGFNRPDRDAGSEYSSRDIAASTPAPPPYGASVQKRHYYSSQSVSSDYDISIVHQQPTTQDQSLLHESQQASQTPQIRDGQYRSQHSQDHAQVQVGVCSREDRYPTSASQHDIRFASSSPAHPPARPYSQSYETGPSLPREFYPQSLPKIESFARERTGSPSARTN